MAWFTAEIARLVGAVDVLGADEPGDVPALATHLNTRMHPEGDAHLLIGQAFFGCQGVLKACQTVFLTWHMSC